MKKMQVSRKEVRSWGEKEHRQLCEKSNLKESKRESEREPVRTHAMCLSGMAHPGDTVGRERQLES